jgi:hypothetical protein
MPLKTTLQFCKAKRGLGRECGSTWIHVPTLSSTLSASPVFQMCNIFRLNAQARSTSQDRYRGDQGLVGDMIVHVRSSVELKQASVVLSMLVIMTQT